MSHTSSNPGGARARQIAMGRYNRIVWWSAAVALVLSAIALIVYALQGPRIREASLDLVRAVAYPEAVLRLESDRPLATIEPSQVRVTPETPVEVFVQGSVVGVVFTEALRYETDYTVEIDGVTGEGSQRGANWSHQFSTPRAQLTYLERGLGSEPDRIFRVGVGADPPREIFQHDSIDVAIPIGSSLVIFSHDQRGADLTIAEPVSGRTERLVLPADTVVDKVFSPGSGTRVLFTLSSLDESGEFDRTLHVIDTAGARSARVVTGLDGEPLRVTKAAVVPGTDLVVAWVDDVAVVSINLLSGVVLPVTQEAAEFWGVSSLGDQAVLVDVAGTVAINVENLTETRLIPGQLAGREVFEGQTHLLADGSRLQTVALGNPAGTDFTSLIVRDDGSGSLDILYRTPQDLGSIGNFVVSPADQYVAIEIVPNRADSVSDGRILEPRSQSVTTVVVDIDSGELVRSVEGFWPVWSR